MIGTVLTLPGAATAELLAEPFDFVWIDMEHAAIGPADAQDMIVGAQAAGTLAFVRVPSDGWASLLAPMVDAGADGIVAADVRTSDHAARIVDKLRHPPHGSRGFGPRRVGTRRRHVGGAGRSAASPQLWVQIESAEGVQAARRIAAVDGVAALVAGCADLSYDLGVPLDLASKPVHDALKIVRDASEQAGILFGLAGPIAPDPGLGDILQQASILMHGTDARICATAVDQLAAQLRRLRSHNIGAAV